MTSFFSSSLFGQAAEATHTAPLPTGVIGSMSGTETRENALLPAGPVSVPKATVADADDSTPDDTATDDPLPLIVSDLLYPAPEPSVAREKSPVKTIAPVADMADKEDAEQDESKGEDATEDKGGDPDSVEEATEEGDKDPVGDKEDDKDSDNNEDEDSDDDSDGASSIADYKASPEPEHIPVQSWPTPRGIKRKAAETPGSATPASKRGRPAKAAKTASGTPTIKKKPGRKPGRPVGRPAAAVRKTVPAPPASLSGRQASLAAKKLMEASVPKRAAAAAAKAALGASTTKRSRKSSGESSKVAEVQGTKTRGTKAAAVKTAAAKTTAKTAAAKTTAAKTTAAKTAASKTAASKTAAAKTAPTKTPKGGDSSAKGSADDEPEEYVVESIVGTRLNAKTKEMEYHIKWAGYPKSQNTWEPRDNLTGCEKLLRTFEKARRTTKKK